MPLFMTTCYDTTEIGRKHLKEAIHLYDFTARSQIVTKKNCHAYYSLIEKFYKKNGIGGLHNIFHGFLNLLSSKVLFRNYCFVFCFFDILKNPIWIF